MEPTCRSTTVMYSSFGVFLITILLMRSSWKTTSVYWDDIISSTGAMTAVPVVPPVIGTRSNTFNKSTSSGASYNMITPSFQLNHSTFEISTAKMFVVTNDTKSVELDRNISSIALTKTATSRNSTPHCFESDTNQTYCCASSWEQNLDHWWQHNPDYEVSVENETTYCFSPMSDPARRKFLKEVLYPLQWTTNCSHTTGKQLVSSGFAANQGLQGRMFMSSLYHNSTFVLSKVRKSYVWIYSRYNNGTKFCESGDMECFFLPISNCRAQPGQSGKAKGRYRLEEYPPTGWGRMYLIRPKHFIRRRIYDLLKVTATPKLPCAAMHVRRTDAIMENWVNKRNYFPIDDYVRALKKRGKAGRPPKFSSIVLLTDDQSAIEEAYEFHPEIPWIHINRTRYRGTEGGYNGHKPSDDPAHEIAIILAEMKLVAKCERLVYTKSGFKDLLIQSMQIEQFDRFNRLDKMEINSRKQPNKRKRTGDQSAKQFFAALNKTRLMKKIMTTNISSRVPTTKGIGVDKSR